MLNINTFRTIKPAGCVDDYVAGALFEMSRAEEGKLFLTAIMESIKTEALSVPQIAVITGKSRAAVAGRLKRQLREGNVTVDGRPTPGAIRPTGFYQAVEGAQC